jgi:hypothetical protein
MTLCGRGLRNRARENALMFHVLWHQKITKKSCKKSGNRPPALHSIAA